MRPERPSVLEHTLEHSSTWASSCSASRAYSAGVTACSSCVTRASNRRPGGNPLVHRACNTRPGCREFTAGGGRAHRSVHHRPILRSTMDRADRLGRHPRFEDSTMRTRIMMPLLLAVALACDSENATQPSALRPAQQVPRRQLPILPPNPPSFPSLTPTTSLSGWTTACSLSRWVAGHLPRHRGR